MADAQRDIFGIRVKCLGFADALADLDSGLRTASHRVVNFLNANNANIAFTDQAYRKALSRSDVLPDGVGVDIAAKLLDGKAFPDNLNGTDLVPALFVHISRPLRVALIGARRDVLERAAENFRRLTPWHEFRPVSDGYFDRDQPQAVLDALSDFRPDVTLVAMGSPVQELWIDRHIEAEHGRLVIGVGALFDFVSGVVPRAPLLVRDLRLEWVYRLLLEPLRLWRRYIVGNPLFLYRVFRYKLAGGAAGGGADG